MVTVGIDEVGRGCWAGPLVAAAVAADDLWVGPIGLRDSKKLSAKRRQDFAKQITSQMKSYGVGWVFPGEIDTLGMTKSVQLAMLRAVKALHQVCSHYDQVVIDGTYNYLQNVQGLRTETIITLARADDSVRQVSAASVIAKVARDHYMAQAAARYPDYGFEKHVGYGTSQHSAALAKHGVTDLHRISFAPIQKMLQK
ncbi:MAG TPA: ribonuclease HII [Candidatus Saccharibacteria bacterium]|jgi:ribonuclease HII|nr:ribonuclease HII [Candidatus Saccharibacteria bacterium]